MKINEMAKVEAKSTTIYTSPGVELSITRQNVKDEYIVWRACFTSDDGRQIRDNFYEKPSEEALNNFLSFINNKLNKQQSTSQI